MWIAVLKLNTYIYIYIYMSIKTFIIDTRIYLYKITNFTKVFHFHKG